MRYKKFSLLFFIVFFLFSFASASTFPLSGVDIIVKSVASGQVAVTKTDNSGSFSASVLEQNGAYNIFINDESLPPIKILAKNKIVSGRVVILTDGTTTKDPAPILVKKSVPVSKTKNVKKTLPLKKTN